jgi:hypothetical protein
MAARRLVCGALVGRSPCFVGKGGVSLLLRSGVLAPRVGQIGELAMSLRGAAVGVRGVVVFFDGVSSCLLGRLGGGAQILGGDRQVRGKAAVTVLQGDDAHSGLLCPTGRVRPPSLVPLTDTHHQLSLHHAHAL